ncbi:hypothetical protein [Natronococcus occultus]|uniref:hypothetical protein n=1 Tax=Natronococcus occultus TaxID=29288 RepID=UPI000677B0F7|nr:hypothetical protein [Natronococcus occultus]
MRNYVYFIEPIVQVANHERNATRKKHHCDEIGPGEQRPDHPRANDDATAGKSEQPRAEQDSEETRRV